MQKEVAELWVEKQPLSTSFFSVQNKGRKESHHSLYAIGCGSGLGSRIGRRLDLLS